MRLFILSILFCNILLAGRFDKSITDAVGADALVNWTRSETQKIPVASAAVNIYNKHFSFAGTYVGNRTVITAAHCVEGESPKTFTARFTTYPQESPLTERTIATAKVIDWKYIKNYELGEDDFAVILLDRDPEGVTPVDLWRYHNNYRSLPNRDGIIVSPVANIDIQEFLQNTTIPRDLPYKERTKHAFYTKLFYGDELPATMKRYMGKQQHKILASLALATPEYQTLNNTTHANIRPGDSGSPVMVQVNGKYYLVGTVSGYYLYAPGVASRDLAYLYTSIPDWYAQIARLAKKLHTTQEKVEKRTLKKQKKKLSKSKKKMKSAQKSWKKQSKTVNKLQLRLNRFQTQISNLKVQHNNFKQYIYQSAEKMTKKIKKQISKQGKKIGVVAKTIRKAKSILSKALKKLKSLLKKKNQTENSYRGQKTKIEHAQKSLSSLKAGIKRFS